MALTCGIVFTVLTTRLVLYEQQCSPMSLKICFLPTVTEYHWEFGAMIEATMLLGKYCVQHVCVFSPREAWRLMGEKETECIVTPCREPKGG